jgi:integrase
MRKTSKATIGKDGYEIYAGFRIRAVKTTAGERFQVDLGKKSGKHVRKSFAVLDGEKGARNWAHKKRIEVDNKGISSLRFSDEQKTDAVEALALLKEFDANLRQAAVFFVKHHQKVSKANGFGALVDQYLAEQAERVEKKTLRPRTVEDAKKRLSPFKSAWERLAVGAIEAKDIDTLLDQCGYEGINRQNYKHYLSGFFNWAIRNKKTTGNPVQQTATVRTKKETPEIYTTEQVKNILKAAEHPEEPNKPHPEIIPYLAIAFFAGIRPEEIIRLSWKDIDLSLGEIHIRAGMSKTHSARLVHISANLKTWLVKYRKESGKVFAFSAMSLKRWRAEIMKAAKVEVIQDGARHTFATFNLALHGIDETMQELGHTDPKMLFKHYRGLAKNRKAQAQKFFAIEPDSEAAVIQFRKTGTE